MQEQLQTLTLEEAFAHELAKDVKLKGGGTAIVCCEQLDRRARLMELDPHFCDVIIARWEKLTGKNAVRISGAE